jgi:hypothetical protein
MQGRHEHQRDARIETRELGLELLRHLARQRLEIIAQRAHRRQIGRHCFQIIENAGVGDRVLELRPGIDIAIRLDDLVAKLPQEAIGLLQLRCLILERPELRHQILDLEIVGRVSGLRHHGERSQNQSCQQAKPCHGVVG